MSHWRRKYQRPARYPGTCSICSEPFPAGELIAWAPHRPADHWKCWCPPPSPHSYTVSPGSARFTTGSSGRNLTTRVRNDLAAVARGHEKHERSKT